MYPLKKLWIALLFCFIVIAAFFVFGLKKTEAPTVYPQTKTETESQIIEFSNHYHVGGSYNFDVDSVLLFAPTTDGYLFDGWFGSEKNMNELSAVSCNLTQVPAIKTETGYTVLTTKGKIVFFETAAGISVDAGASSKVALSSGCLSGVTWADLPLNRIENKNPTKEEYESMLNRG